MNERDIDKKTIAINAHLRLVAKVVKAYHRDGDSGKGQAFVRAMEFATKDVILTVEEEHAVEQERMENYRRRIESRQLKKR